MFEIKVVGEFSGAHNLRGYRGRCEQLHGHNWRIEVKVLGENLNSSGMLMDFRQIESRLNKVLDKLDHGYLNRHSYFKRLNPTSENIAKYIYENLKKRILGLKSVTVWESRDCSASYYGR